MRITPGLTISTISKPGVLLFLRARWPYRMFRHKETPRRMVSLDGVRLGVYAGVKACVSGRWETSLTPFYKVAFDSSPPLTSRYAVALLTYQRHLPQSVG